MNEFVAEAFKRRVAPLQGLAADATSLALACRDMAARFTRGGRLLVFGNGGCATDAQHISVEFVHPVIVGKRALPALSLVSDGATVTGVAERHGLDAVYAHQVRTLGRPDDIALGLIGAGDGSSVAAGLQAASEAGLLTVALVGEGDTCIDCKADHCLTIRSADSHVIKEGHVTAYHLLWELVHVFFDAPETGESTPPAGLEQLYPMLYGGTGESNSVLEAATESARQKIDEAVSLRREVGASQGMALAACATELAHAFAAGGTLLAFGNGGSSSDAQDVVHTFVDPEGGPALPAIGLTNDVAVLTALSNDVGFEVTFSRQIRAFGREGDIAFAISTSGGSPNVLAGLQEAARVGMTTVGLAGYGGGRMAELPELQHLFAVPSSSVHRVQEVQTTLYHVLAEATLAAWQGEMGRR